MPLNRIDETFKKLRREQRCGLIAYVTCGDPDRDLTVEIVLALEKAGANFIELGIPFSDPIADGPVIQAASFRALQRGTTVSDVLSIARRVRERSSVPLIAFSYLNPVLRFGVERFADQASESGVDGALITDLPPESSTQVRKALRARGLRTIFLLSPTSPPDRITLVDRMSSGFVYYVSTAGVTGQRSELDPHLIERLVALRTVVKQPLAVGFGISANGHYEALRKSCDAVVVGSAIVKAIEEGPSVAAPERAAAVVTTILGQGVR